MYINIHVKQYSSFADDYHCGFEILFHVFSHLLSNFDSFSLFWVVFKLYLRQFNYCFTSLLVMLQHGIFPLIDICKLFFWLLG